MQSKSHRLSRVAGLASAAVVIFGATLGNAWAADPAPDRATAWAQHRQQWVRAKLERNANRLEIKASQQAAWQEYAAARTAMAERHVGRPGADLDAAAMMKWRADRAAESARKLAVLADATAKLEVVLSPEQRQTLGQIMHEGHRGHFAHAHHGWHHGSEDRHGDGRPHAAEGDDNRADPSA
jgi:hypothetical protein